MDNILGENKIINYWFVWWSGASHWHQPSSFSWLKITKGLKYKIWNEEANFFFWLPVVRRKIYLSNIRVKDEDTFMCHLLSFYFLYMYIPYEEQGKLGKYFIFMDLKSIPNVLNTIQSAIHLLDFYCQSFPYFQCLLKTGFSQTLLGYTTYCPEWATFYATIQEEEFIMYHSSSTMRVSSCLYKIN